MTSLNDMHCHLSLMEDGLAVAVEALHEGCLLFNNTVTPQEWLETRQAFAPFPNVTTGFGMHPWYVSPSGNATEDDKREGGRTTGETLAKQCLQLLNQHQPQAIGEIGLDFGPRHTSTAQEQLRIFTAIARWAAHAKGRLISIHSVKSTRETLDTLEATGALEECCCIFHWFSGPSDQLKRAIRNGCFFSCNPRMLSTAKGREYVRAIPAKRLLLETDWPLAEGDDCTFSDLKGQLQEVAQSIVALKGAEALSTIAETSKRLLTPPGIVKSQPRSE